MQKKTIKQRLSYGCFLVVRGILRLCYPKKALQGQENLPPEPCVVVANHCHMHGPLCGEFYFPGPRKIWCAGQMMHLKDVPAYSFQDFWHEKPNWSKPFYKLLSYLIAPLSVCIFKNAKTIGVYRDGRIISTFRKTVSSLEKGENVIIFPEHLVPHNNIVYDFQDKFIDVAKLYHKRTGKALPFVPMYIAPKLKTMYLGQPVVFDPEAPIAQERERIRTALMDAITGLAAELPLHTVVPYPNVPSKRYPKNLPVTEVSTHEKTCC